MHFNQPKLFSSVKNKTKFIKKEYAKNTNRKESLYCKFIIKTFNNAF